MNTKIKKMLYSVGVTFLVLGISIGLYSYNKPFNVYQRALEKTSKQTKINIKSNLASSGKLEELSSQSVEYAIDKENKIIEVSKKEKDKTKTNLYINKDKLYVKDGDYYVDILNSDYIDKLTSNLTVEGTDIYDAYQSNISKSIDKNSIKVKKGTKTINNQKVKLKLLEITIDKDKAKKIISEYIKKEYLSNLENVVSETIESEVELAKSNNITYSDEEIETLKEKLLETLTSKLEEKLKSMKYSNIEIIIGVDKNGLIRYREEKYNITIDKKNNSIKNTTKYIAFGDDVKITNPKSIKVKKYEDIVTEHANEMKEELKENSLDQIK